MENNDNQRSFIDHVVEHVTQSEQCCCFLDAPGGTGKTFCLNAVLSFVRSKRKVALAVATTGIAALLLAGGSTAHSRFKIPLAGLDSNSACEIPAQSQLADLLRNTTIIVYDEGARVSTELI